MPFTRDKGGNMSLEKKDLPLVNKGEETEPANARALDALRDSEAIRTPDQLSKILLDSKNIDFSDEADRELYRRALEIAFRQAQLDYGNDQDVRALFEKLNLFIDPIVDGTLAAGDLPLSECSDAREALNWLVDTRTRWLKAVELEDREMAERIGGEYTEAVSGRISDEEWRSK